MNTSTESRYEPKRLTLTHTVGADMAGARLDAFLKELYRKRSRESLKSAITDQEREEAIATLAWDLARTGPFKEKVRVEAAPEAQDPRGLREVLEQAGIDEARSNRLVVLDPRRFSLLNGLDADTRAALRAVRANRTAGGTAAQTTPRSTSPAPPSRPAASARRSSPGESCASSSPRCR